MKSIRLPDAVPAAHRGWRRQPLGPRADVARVALATYLVAIVFRLATIGRDLVVSQPRPAGAVETVSEWLLIALGLFAGVAFIFWLRRVWNNWATQGKPRYSSAWVLLAWFVPPLNLWRPAEIVADLFADRPGLRRIHRDDARLIALWWLGGLFGVAGRLYLSLRPSAESAVGAVSASTGGGAPGGLFGPVDGYQAAVVYLLLALSAVAGLRLVTELTRRHDVAAAS